jgi:hypothetical protein
MSARSETGAVRAIFASPRQAFAWTPRSLSDSAAASASNTTSPCG